MAARLLRARFRASFRRVRIDTPDGDFLDLDVHVPTRSADPDSPSPTVLVLHGLEGCSSSGYVVASCHHLAAHGVRAIALNFRGRSGEPNRTPRFYHSGETNDLGLVVERLRTRRPELPLGALGFSLGGNVLMKFLGERGEGVGLEAAAAVSVPFDLAACARRMDRGVCRLYQASFLRSLRTTVRRKARLFPDAYDIEAAERARSLREFDDAVTAPVHGFEGAEEYYRASSASRWVSGIRVPTLVLQAADDPFVPAAAVPRRKVEENPATELRLTPSGGHVGFVERTGGSGIEAEGGLSAGPFGFWAERVAARALATALGENS